MGNSTDAGELWSRRAGSFGAHAADYATHRPDYPAAAIRWALAPLGDRTPVVLDLGAGTGKLTEGLLDVGAEVIAVEPDPGMRAELIRRYPAVSAHAGSAESIPLPDDSVDAVLAGQAFHWFDQQRAFPEIARVLRPHGVCAAFWNSDDIRVPWVAGLKRVARTSVPNLPHVPNIDGSEQVPAHPLFEPFERAEFPHVQRRTAESLTATIGTHSHTLVVSDEQRAEVLSRIAEYLRNTPETATGEFELPLVTLTIRATVRDR